MPTLIHARHVVAKPDRPIPLNRRVAPARASRQLLLLAAHTAATRQRAAPPGGGRSTKSVVAEYRRRVELGFGAIRDSAVDVERQWLPDRFPAGASSDGRDHPHWPRPPARDRAALECAPWPSRAARRLYTTDRRHRSSDWVESLPVRALEATDRCSPEAAFDRVEWAAVVVEGPALRHQPARRAETPQRARLPSSSVFPA